MELGQIDGKDAADGAERDGFSEARTPTHGEWGTGNTPAYGTINATAHQATMGRFGHYFTVTEW